MSDMKLHEFEAILRDASKEADRIALSRKLSGAEGNCVVVPAFTSRQKSIATRLGADVDERGLVFTPHDTRIPPTYPHLRAVWVVVFADYLTSMGLSATVH